MGDRLKGRTAIITGGGRGIGRGISLLMASEGANVVVNDIGVSLDGAQPSDGPANDVVDEIKTSGGSAVPSFDSVATVEGGEKIIRTALDNYGRVDIVVHVAGVLRDRMVFNMTEDEWDQVIAVHLKGYFAIAKPAAILMRQQRYGRIIGFSSGSGLNGNSGQANYGAAKAGIAGMTRVIARDLGRYGVTCNSIAPTAATRMTQSVPDTTREIRARQGIAASSSSAPSPGAYGAAEAVAPFVTYLASDYAWNINGKVFYVTGGHVGLAYEEEAERYIVKNDKWTIDELAQLVPQRLLYGLLNPAPPPTDLDIPGRPVPAKA
jgi:NAD(P)-dependent dehydrogenase (short-subunit alcohol dehydrogenase family)